MTKEFFAFLTVFRKGKEVANPKTWKRGQIAGSLTTLMGALLVIAGGFGYDIKVDDTTLKQLAGGIGALFTVVNIVCTVVSSSKIGLPAKPSTDPFPSIEKAD